MFRKLKGGKQHVVNNEDDDGITMDQLNNRLNRLNDIQPPIQPITGDNNNINLNEYTPLIRAIQQRDWHAVIRLLRDGADPNERDNIEGWTPMKWANYMYFYGPDHNVPDNKTACNIIGQILTENGVNIANDFDNNRIPSSYNFYPRINDNRRGYNAESNTRTNGGSAPTEEQRIIAAMDGNYTPLINAINRGNFQEVRNLLEEGADPNQRDGVAMLNWCPMKWAAFAHFHGWVMNDEGYDELIRILRDGGSRTCYDDYHVRENEYNYYPVITTINEQLEQLRRDAEEEENDDYDILANTRNTAGGTRKRRARKSRKHKKTHKKVTRSSNRRRKHMKK